MAPTPLRKLTSQQNARFSEIEVTSSRLKAKPRSEFTLDIVISRIDALNELWAEVRGTHLEIVGRDDHGTDAYTADKVFARIQGLYQDTLDFLYTVKSELDKDALQPVPSVGGSTSNVDSRTAKLPRLDLPSFSGRYEDWENFYDLFGTLVHDAAGLSDATKLQYLKTCLKGSAAELVKDVSTTNANYATTWEALRARFHNPRLIVYSHLRALKEIPHMRKESATEMRSLADESQRIVRALKNLGMPVDHWDVVLVFELASRLDPESRKAWETEMSRRDRRIVTAGSTVSGRETNLDRFPKFSEFTEFLENRAQTLGMLASESKSDRGNGTGSKHTPGSRKVFHASSSATQEGRVRCPDCKGPHKLHKCYRFREKSSADRRAEVRRLRLCFNCFGRHKSNECQSSFRCFKCKERHHSLLHFDTTAAGSSTSQAASSGSGQSGESGGDKDAKPASVNVHTASLVSNSHSVLLATAQVTVVGPRGASTRARALLDQGSEASFVSEAIANLLGLEKSRASIALTGLGATPAGRVRAVTRLRFCSLVQPSVQFETNALVLPKLASQLPSRRALRIDFGLLADLSLADPQFYVPDSVDIILGADVYGQLLREGLKRFPSSSLVAQDTALGWILSGPVPADDSRRADARARNSVTVQHCATRDPLDESLQRFWELEEIRQANSLLDPEDEECEKQFRETHTRDASGRYVVHLPFAAELPEDGASTRHMALSSLSHTYRRFERDPRLAHAYREFMATYERLGHMERVPDAEIDNPKAWYLPHHPVVKASESGYKVRVVFDAKRKNREQRCCNDFLRKGPALQLDLSLVLLNWRRYQFVFTGDIVKMFRQIRVTPEHRDFQRIVWAPNRSDAPVDYRLTTVTYGTACAPYLAIRTLRQLAAEQITRFPLGARCLTSNTYVDDIFAGDDDLAVAIRTRQELVEMLGTAGIELDKWAANHPKLLPSRASDAEAITEKSIGADEGESVKTLGLRWNPNADEFSFSQPGFEALAGALTKRAVLSNIARLFDPLGWLAPITIVAKVLMQDLWIVKIDWDETLPTDLRDRWIEYCRSLSGLSELAVPRWFGSLVNASAEIHGFCDASSRAFAAAVYIRIVDRDGQCRVALLAAKTKVAPVKTVSIPNLELCGAVLLVKLVGHLRGLECLRNLPMFTWTDSRIVLTWLRKHACTWKTFVANRVSFIQSELPSATWAHVPTKENPADLATRGCTPVELSEAHLWWQGPQWLMMPSEHWPKAATVPQVLHVKTATGDPEILRRFSSYTRLIRVVAYCLRPLKGLRRRKNGLDPLPDFVTASELSEARAAVIRLAQERAFSAEIEILRAGKKLPKSSALLRLDPTLDASDGLLRVGGRLANSELPYERKHPPILPHESYLSQLLVRYAHHVCLHGGPTLTANTVMRYAWILGRTRLVKTTVRNCLACQRNKPRLAHQMMGNLPSSRVTPARPFSTSGLDYAGPFMVRTSKGRGHKAYKGYIALFVCFSSRAIHLEVVSDLTTQTFLAAYKRFVSRRGICRELYSDNASTFQAADRELHAMFRAGSEFYKEAAASLANDGTAWKFIPPTSPHYGGLWEAGVKSVKHHLRRAVGDRSLTFEEFSTVLAEVEACLNSRPLCPLKADADDLRALTPAHFLIGEASGLVPDAAPPDVPENRLERFHLLQAIRNAFWRRWSTDYLQHLQERGKWRGPTENFAVGQLVLLRDDRYPPAKWPLGRVVEVHLGADGLVRVVTVKTATSTLRRHIARLSPLSLGEGPNDGTR